MGIQVGLKSIELLTLEKYNQDQIKMLVKPTKQSKRINKKLSS